MFPDSLTFSVNAVYAAQASCGVPSILDERYYQTFFFFFCWLLHFTLNLPWQRANSPEAKSMIFTLKSNTSPSWRIGQEIRLHFIHTPRFGGIIVFPPVGLVAGLKVSVRFWEVHICWHAGNLSQISVINIYIYIGTPRPSSSSSSSPSSSVGRSIFPLTSWLCYILLLNVTQKNKWICHNRWSGKWTCMQPKTVMWTYLFPLPTTKSTFMHNQWCFQTVFLSLWSHLRPYLLSLCEWMRTCRQDQGHAYRPSSIPQLCVLFFYTYKWHSTAVRGSISFR